MFYYFYYNSKCFTFDRIQYDVVYGVNSQVSNKTESVVRDGNVSEIKISTSE